MEALLASMARAGAACRLAIPGSLNLAVLQSQSLASYLVPGFGSGLLILFLNTHECNRVRGLSRLGSPSAGAVLSLYRVSKATGDPYSIEK